MLLDLYLRRPRGLSFVGNHPWIALLVLVLVVALALYLRSRDR